MQLTNLPPFQDAVASLNIRSLAPGDVHVIDLGKDRRGRIDEILVVRDLSGEIRAYQNLCKHIPVPMGPTDFVDDDGKHFICRLHGALYRFSDGKCVTGPCRGAKLDALRVEIRGDDAFLFRT